MASGDSASYAKLNAAGVRVDTTVRTTAAIPAKPSEFLIQESDQSGISQSQYLKSSVGLTVLNPLVGGNISPMAAAIVGNILEYQEQLHAVGEMRTLLRQGSWGVDLNQDGVPEGFKFVYSQVNRGFEPLVIAGKTMSVAHFSNTLTLSIISSNPLAADYTLTVTEEAFFVSGFGMVKAVRKAIDSFGTAATPEYTLLLESGLIEGQSWVDFLTDYKLLTIPLDHEEIVYVPAQGKYFASIPENAAGIKNAIAAIDPVTGLIQFTPLDGNPSGIAPSFDGAYLYVALRSTGDLVKLSLPSLTEVGRLRIASDDPLIGLSNVPLKLYPSPVEQNLVVVGTTPGLGLSSMNIAVVSNMSVISTRMSPEFNAAVFNSAGTILYAATGSYPDTLKMSSFSLSSGVLTLANEVAYPDIYQYGAEMHLLDSSLIQGTKVFDLSLTFLGNFESNSTSIVKGNRVISATSLNSPGTGTTDIAIVDVSTRQIISRLNMGNQIDYGGPLRSGPQHQLAMSSGFFTGGSTFHTLRLVNSSLLP
jgi:hypothetical protein